MNPSLLLPLVLGLAAAVLPAQTLFTSQTTQSLGDGCNSMPTGTCRMLSLPTSLVAEFDASAGTVTVRVDSYAFCGVVVPVTVLALGLQPANVPLPALGPSCVLYLHPLAVLANANEPFVLPLPPGVPSLTFLVQGAALGIDPMVGFVVTTSDALAISLQ
ncbi:MAG: hypothetical protein JNL12_05155 [Planctomycetes bacterium]|nr:hypothetical protein [Planctomycetota bacterium]